jgi:formate dehydrogenase subunit gamma
MHPPADLLPRFSRGETLIHRSTAVLVTVLVATGAVLYDETLAVAVGRRPVMAGLHVTAGILLAAPTALGLLLDPAFRHDVARLGRFGPDDWTWLRRKDRRDAGLRVGKFNGGQKLAGSVLAGSGLVLIGSGLLLLAPLRLDLPERVREGATFTHDVFTFGLIALLIGHSWQAWRHPEARAALRTGRVDRGYAERQHSEWAASPD